MSHHLLRAAGAAAVAVSMIALSACTSTEAPGASASTDPNAAVTLTWWTGQSDAAEKLLEDLAAEFTKLHPNVTIKTSSGASSTEELLQKLSAGIA